MANIFGWEIKRNEKEPISFTPKENDDGAVVVQEGGIYGTYVDLDGSIKTEAELVTKYREMSGHQEVDTAIDHIVNDAIINDPEETTVSLMLDGVEYPDNIKKKFTEEFEEILRLLQFNELSYETFKRWYVDGRLYYHVIIDEQDPSQGIKELRYIDPRKIRKIRQVKEKKSVNSVSFKQTVGEYYVYNERGFAKTIGQATGMAGSANGIKIAKDSILHCTSGLNSQNGDLVIGYLNTAIKPLNQLKTMEDSLVIYRISRAPERRIFYIDVGNLPKLKAEQYLRDTMTRFKNKVVYDQATGEVRDSRKFMTMLEDFWLPRREGGRGTEITTLPGGQNLGQMDDVVYFQKLLYKSLKVPVTRLDPEQNFNLGRSTEITRDEINFDKFITRLRNKFSVLFIRALEKQLILKQIITAEDWDEIKDLIKFKFAHDNYFAELKEQEILQSRVTLLRDIDDYSSMYYSHEWIRKNVLRQSDEDIKEIDKQIKKEATNPQYNPPLDADGNPIPGAAGTAPLGPQANDEAPEPSAGAVASQSLGSIDKDRQIPAPRPVPKGRS